MPCDTAVTVALAPEPETVATLVLEDDHDVGAALKLKAVRLWVPPTVILAEDGLIYGTQLPEALGQFPSGQYP